jgi:hypothetical protein
MLAQPGYLVEDLFRESRIDVIEVGQKAAANILGLLEGHTGFLYLRDGSYHYPGICPNKFARQTAQSTA